MTKPSFNPSLIALSGDAYELLLNQIADMKATAEANENEVNRLQLLNLENSLKHENTKHALNTVCKHLAKFLDEFEGAFDSDEKCASPEIALDYIEAATYMKKNFNRSDAGFIDRVQTWFDNYKPWGA